MLCGTARTALINLDCSFHNINHTKNLTTIKKLRKKLQQERILSKEQESKQAKGIKCAPFEWKISKQLRNYTDQY